MPIDPSIPLRAGAGIQPLNPLQTLLQGAQFRYMNSNANALQQQIDANIATSRGYQAATDPVTGQVNNNKLISILSQDPNAAYNLGTVIQGINAQKQQNVTLETTKQALATKRWEAFGKAAANFTTNPDATGADYVNEITNMVGQGVVDAPTALQELKRVAPYLNDPAKLKQMVRESLAGLPAEIQQRYILPQIQAINTGMKTNIVATNPITGSAAVTGSLANTASPDVAIKPTPTFRNGVPGTVPLGSTPGAAPYVGGASAAAAPGGSNFNPTGPALGQADIAKAGADRYNALTQSAGEAPIAINGYDRALDALDSMSGGILTGGTGPGADTSHLITGVMNALGFQVSPNDTANYQTLKKYLANAASQAASASGYSGSDARLSAFEHGQPDASKMNPEALRGAIQYVKALQQGVIAKNNAAQAYLQAHGGNTATLPAFETQWSHAFTPDVMEYRNMSPDQMQAYVKGLSPEKLAAFKQSYSQMAALGAF